MMGLANTKAGYGVVSIALHWFGAAGVIAMFAIGLNAEWAAEAGDRERGDALMALHVALGATLFAVLIGRIVAHYVQARPAVPKQARALTLLSALTHHGMLAAILILMISGPLAIWSLSEPIDVWGIQLASPFAVASRDLHEFAEVMHGFGRYILWVLVPLHLLGVLKHVVFDRDEVLLRMLRPVKR